MRVYFIFTCLLFSTLTDAQAGDPEDGYAIVRSDTIYGKIVINFDSGSILVRQDSINRMFLTDIEQVTLLNDERETFMPVENGDKSVFYKVLVQGRNPLLEAGELFFTLNKGNLKQVVEEKDLYDLFGKRDVKDYIFLRNIKLAEKNGLIDVFRYFNKHESF